MEGIEKIKSVTAVFFLALFCVSFAFGETYYVDNNGDDKNIGSKEKPFKTVQKAADIVKEGDTVVVNSGVYEERVVTKTNGSSSMMITFKGEKGAIIRSFVINNNFVKVTGFEMFYDVPGYKPKMNYKEGIVTPKWAFIEINNAEGCQVINNIIRNGKKYLCGVLFTGNSKNCLVKGNRFYRINYYPIELSGEGNVIEDNIIEDTIWDGIRVVGRNHIIRGNYFTLVNQGGVGYPSIVLVRKFKDNGACNSILFEKNYAKTCHAKICRLEETNSSGIVFKNNVFEDITCSAKICVPEVKFFGNIFINSCRDRMHVLMYYENANNGTVKENIFVGCGIDSRDTSQGWYFISEKVTGFSADDNWVCGPFPEFSAKKDFKEQNGKNGGNPFEKIKGDYHPAWRVPVFTIEKVEVTEEKQKNRKEKDIGKMKKSDRINEAGMELEIIDIVNPDIITSKFAKRYKYDRFENPKLKLLREKYKLDKVIEPGKNEFEKMLYLMEWVGKQFKFDHPSIVSDSALDILEECAKGGTFFCLQYSDVMLACANSLGWVCRLMDIRMKNPGGTEHTTTDIWSNQFRKWIMLDATGNVYFEKKDKQGIPLSPYEIREERIKNGNKNIFMVKGIRQIKSEPDISRVDKYCFIHYIANGDLLDSPKDFGDRSFMIIDDFNKDVEWHRRESPKDPKEIYWTLGEAKMQIYIVDKGKLEVNLETQTPNFDTFLVKVDSEEWQKSGDKFFWNLKKGENKLTVTTINKFGITGPENYIIVKYY